VIFSLYNLYISQVEFWFSSINTISTRVDIVQLWKVKRGKSERESERERERE